MGLKTKIRRWLHRSASPNGARDLRSGGSDSAAAGHGDGETLACLQSRFPDVPVAYLSTYLAIKPFTMVAIASFFLGNVFLGLIGPDAVDFVRLPFGADLAIESASMRTMLVRRWN